MTICHPRREPLCGSVRRFPVLGGNFSRGAGRAACKGVQRVKNGVGETHTTDDTPPMKMLGNVEIFKGQKTAAHF